MSISSFFKKLFHAPYDLKKPIRSRFYKIIRISYLAFKGFYSKGCYLRASLLTFYTLISIVPMFAIIFSIAKGFGFEKFLQEQILATFQEQKEVISMVLRFSYAFLKHIQSSTILGIGVFFLFFSVFGLFENIEKSLNAIWNIKKYRGFVRRTLNYLASIIVFPIFFIFSTSITIFLNSEIIRLVSEHQVLQTYLLMSLKIAPYGLMFILFSYIYIFTPNSKTYYSTRFIAAIIASIFFQFWQIIYIKFQVYISTYNIVYGSFAALPLFLIWMQINFAILLFGAEIAAQIEGDKFYKKTSDDEVFITIPQKNLTLFILDNITLNFLKGTGPLSIMHISEHLGISLLDTREALNILQNTNFIVEISSRGRFLEKYQLIINPESFTVNSAGKLIEEYTQNKKSIVKKTDNLNKIMNYFSQSEKLIEDSKLNMNLKDFSYLKSDLHV